MIDPPLACSLSRNGPLPEEKSSAGLRVWLRTKRPEAVRPVSVHPPNVSAPETSAAELSTLSLIDQLHQLIFQEAKESSHSREEAVSTFPSPEASVVPHSVEKIGSPLAMAVATRSRKACLCVPA